MMYDGVIEKPSIDDLFDESCFAHYGVKGMKWGVRKAINNVVSGIRKKRSIRPKVKVSLNLRRPSTGVEWMSNKISSADSSNKLINKLGSTYYGPAFRHKKIKSINSLSSKAKRGFKEFKSKLSRNKKIKLSALTGSNSTLNKLSRNSKLNYLTTNTHSSKNPKAKINVNNVLKSTINNPFADDLTRSLYNRNEELLKRLGYR